MKRSEIKEVLEMIIELETDNLCKEFCNPNYFKNRFLDYAIANNTSLQCMVRTYAEMLYTAYKIGLAPDTLKHVNQLVSFLNVYTNDEQLELCDDFFKSLRLETAKKYPYIIIKFPGRLKSFESTEAKLRIKNLRGKVLPGISANLENVLGNLKCSKDMLEKNLNSDTVYKYLKSAQEILQSDEYLKIAREILQELELENSQKNPVQDAIGYRGIIEAFNTSTDETVLTNFLYEYVEFIKEFVQQEMGYDIIEIKDYVKNPKKKTKYRSYHMTLLLGNTPVELQLRTVGMHFVAEYGTASHDDVYKNTELQNFLKEFLQKISSKNNKTTFIRLNDMGLTKEIRLPRDILCQTPHSEVPKVVNQLKTFENIEFLKSCF